jgi:uridine kinase
MLEDASVISAILEKRKALSPHRALLVGISGIDAAGKGFVAARIAQSLEKHGIRPAVINVDGWLNLPHIRFHPRNPAEHFYEHAIRFEEMFERVVLPLRDTRHIDAQSDFAEETAIEFRKHRYQFHNIDVVVIEGIFLFKLAYRHHFDLTIWVDCSFAVALQRAIARGQEKLSPRDTERAFETIYFAAQRLHLDRDDPRGAAEFILTNDKSVATNCGIS